jgi:hypothetical protein
MNMISNPYFHIIGDRLIFSKLGLEEHRHYFGQVGIDIRSIKTLDDYYRARVKAAPFFQERLLKRLRKGSNSFEMQALIAIAEGDYEKLNRIEQIIDNQDQNYRQNNEVQDTQIK